MDKDGTIYPQLVKKRIIELSGGRLDKSLDCLETVPPIVTCDDVRPLIKCILGWTWFNYY